MSRYVTLEFDEFLKLNVPNPGIGVERSMRAKVLSVLTDLAPPDDETVAVVDGDNEVLEERTFLHYPDPGGIFPWGTTQNGDIGLWVTIGHPDEWRVAVTDGSSLWMHSAGLVDFLVQAINGSIACPLLPHNGRLDGIVKEFTRSDLTD
ncbi:hypothetical protein ACFWY5_28365 [Nonomuraea sp. NPDC059007]|uniref:hypothetical protein n=1 Tax=Nonomuraea sp. NPDC059007 TaxID=3346692 RepID=UPI0036C3BE2E